jgi:TonB family protein
MFSLLRPVLGCALISACAAAGWSFQREPIRVGSTVQESKLIKKVDPILPETARQARISGAVILQVTVTESGDVSDTRVLRGHPLLDSAALDAVRQWRYAPTLLNGTPVAVTFSATVEFSADGSPSMRLIMNETGDLREVGTGFVGKDILEKVRATGGPRVTILPNPLVPFDTLEETARILAASGGVVRVEGPFAFRDGRLFYVSIAAPAGAPIEAVEAPEYVLDTPHLAEVARRTGADRFLGGAPQGARSLQFQLFVDEGGRVLAAQLLNGPRSPELEAEIMKTRILTPGRRAGAAVSVAFTVTIPLE